MYCNRCGRTVADHSSYCNYCGARLDSTRNQTVTDDRSSFGFALLGFFIPLVGLILFLIYEGKQPKRAKSAGKGALIGFITKIVLAVVIFVAYLFFSVSVLSNVTDSLESLMPDGGNIIIEERLEDCAEVTFGEFTISDNGYFSETSLDVTVKNTAETRCTFFVTIEAVDENGARLATDMICADRLNPGQEIHLTAFSYVEQEKIGQYKTATFKVLEIDAYD